MNLSTLAPLVCMLVGFALVGVSSTAATTDSPPAPNYLLYSGSRARQHEDIRLERLLTDSNHSHVSDAINLPLANSIWTKMRKNALDYAQQRAEQSRPIIHRLLSQANVSSACSESLDEVLNNLAKLNHWAVQMYNAFGEFPAVGFFEGSHTSMGSYAQCVDVGPNRHIGQPQYCTYKFQPIVPKRPRYHNILAAIENLANFTSKDDMFNKLAGKAHYFYYTKLRLATCMPSKCEKSDLESLGKQVALNTYLQYSGVSCLRKEVGFNPDGAQIFALIILISMASVTLVGTLVHVLNLRSFVVGRQASAAATAALDAAEKETLHNGANQQVNSNSMIATDLNGNKNGRLQQRQQNVVLHAQQTAALLASPKELAGSILPALNGHQNNDSIAMAPISKRANLRHPTLSYDDRKYSQILAVLDTLQHFSIVQNGRKLFDTSTSAGQSNGSVLASIITGAGSRSNSINNHDSASTASTSSSFAADSEHNSSATTTNGQRSNEISCVHGLRFWTICWIIFGHTMQYTEWAGFARAYQVEQNIVSFFLQPLLNATFSVDTFFLISGLLTTYVTWSMTRGQYRRFNKFAFLISRYLRLTPQVLLVILLFIVFPMAGDGPYWRGLIQKESDNCKQNWWVSALYLQAFVNSDKICNLVTWWLSIEMLYHFISITVIIALLHSTRRGVMTAAGLASFFIAISCYIHYNRAYPPNMLPTLLQRYEVWDSIVLRYFWTPYPHAPAYFVGLLLGYVLYTHKISHLTGRQAKIGWIAFTVCYLAILFGTYNWNNNAPYSRITSTVYYNMSQVCWAFATGWAIFACALGHGGWLNAFLSSPVFIPLGRATYMTYLSHMLVVMSYPAKMNLLIEPSYTVFLYIFISNMFLSYALGITLTLVYESPILHLQKMLVANMAQRYDGPETETNAPEDNKKISSKNGDFVSVSLYDTNGPLTAKEANNNNGSTETRQS